jgi:hypothetical protein
VGQLTSSSRSPERGCSLIPCRLQGSFVSELPYLDSSFATVDLDTLLIASGLCVGLARISVSTHKCGLRSTPYRVAIE